MTRGYGTRRGAALVLALVITAIMSALLSGVLLLSVSHLNLSNVDSNYANALNLAEAGINWELWKLTHDPATADVVWTSWAELPAGSGRSYRVQISNADPVGGPWAPPSPCWITAEGRVDGIVRTVRVQAKGFGMFGKYALYGINALNVGGNATINGAAGTNGVLDITGNPNLNGNFWYNGPGATGDSVEGLVTEGHEIFHSPVPEVYPTVNEVADEWAQVHWTAAWEAAPHPVTVNFFKQHNNNDQIVNSLGAPVINNGRPELTDKVFGTDDSLTLGPGDYYFENVDLQTKSLHINNAAGVVNIWIGPAAGTGKVDSINGNCFLFASDDVAHFRIYDGSARTLRLNGTMDFHGCILAYNGPNHAGDYYGEVQLNGDGTVFGSVVGYNVSRNQASGVTGNVTITYESTGGGPVPGDPILYWGISQTWEEVNPA